MQQTAPAGEQTTPKFAQESALLDIPKPNEKTPREIAEYIIDAFQKQNVQLKKLMESSSEKLTMYYHSCWITKFSAHTAHNEFLGRADQEAKTIKSELIVLLEEWGIQVQQ